MRFTIAALLGLLLTANLAGCGGASIPEPPSDAKEGPPPGTSDAWSKKAKK
jgi:hypothetical protein